MFSEVVVGSKELANNPVIVISAFVLIFWRVRAIEKQLNNGLSHNVQKILTKLGNLDGRCAEREKRLSHLEDQIDG